MTTIEQTGQLSTPMTDAASSSLGKDDFMKLLITQLEHQDPLQPMDNTQFVAQLAQFSSLEQLSNVTEGLGMLQIQQMSAGNVQAASLVGQGITAIGNGFEYDGVGGQELSFELSGQAESVSVNIVDSSGAHVRTIEVGSHEAGTVELSWDGTTSSGTPAAAGDYSLEIEAVDVDGNPINVETQLTGTVSGIYFDHGYAELEVNGSRVQLGDIVSIVDPGSTTDGEGR